MIAGLLALVIAAMFTGAALYINVAEHPARAGLPIEPAVLQWRPAYKRGFAMQASLAVIGGGLALTQWWLGGGAGWLAGGLVLLANWPWTMLVIMPVNRRLLADGAERGEGSRALLAQWNRLHAGRTLLGLLATALLFMAMLG